MRFADNKCDISRRDDPRVTQYDDGDVEDAVASRYIKVIEEGPLGRKQYIGPPQVTKDYDVAVRVGEASHKKIVYQNVIPPLIRPIIA